MASAKIDCEMGSASLVMHLSSSVQGRAGLAQAVTYHGIVVHDFRMATESNHFPHACAQLHSQAELHLFDRRLLRFVARA